MLLCLVTLSYCIALFRGLMPLDFAASTSLDSYFSNFNALRSVKGFFEALAIGWLMNRWLRVSPTTFERLWISGAALGLVAFSATVVWERFLFPGVFDFVTHYRVSGTFSSLQIGGSPVETYLVLTMPLALVWALSARAPLLRFVATTIVLALGVYSLLVTFARSAFAALLVELAVFAGLLVLAWGFSRRLKWAMLVLAAVTGAALLASGHGYLNERFQQVRKDWNIRAEHWSDVAALVSTNWVQSLVGVGAGTFPRTYLLENPQARPIANYRFIAHGGNRFLRFGGSDLMFFGQRVDTFPDHHYVLEFDARVPTGTGVGVHLCEKDVTQSSRCQNLHWRPSSSGEWAHIRMPIYTGAVGELVHGFRRPVELSFNAEGGGLIDLDNVKLLPGKLIENGDFERANARWFFTVDDHLAWHAKNFWLQVYFDQGWFGVLTIAAVILYQIAHLIPAARRGDLVSIAVLSSLGAWLAMGVFSSVMDDPKLMLWFYLLVIYSILRSDYGIVSKRPPVIQGRRLG